MIPIDFQNQIIFDFFRFGGIPDFLFETQRNDDDRRNNETPNFFFRKYFFSKELASRNSQYFLMGPVLNFRKP